MIPLPDTLVAKISEIIDVYPYLIFTPMRLLELRVLLLHVLQEACFSGELEWTPQLEMYAQGNRLAVNITPVEDND